MCNNTVVWDCGMIVSYLALLYRYLKVLISGRYIFNLTIIDQRFKVNTFQFAIRDSIY